MSAASDVTHDGFLDRRLTIAQPASGFRAGHDSVLLAAAVPAGADSALLELGAGVGVASLCVAARVAECRVTGIELDPELVALAEENAARNGLAARVRFISGDVMSTDLGGARFDHVFFNPPFHPVTGRPSPDAGRARATHDGDDALSRWTMRAMACTKPGGTVSVIMRADRLDAWRTATDCAVTALPLLPRTGATPKRIIARLNPGEPRSFQLAQPFVLHEADGKPTAEAERVLRHGEALDFR